jgi:serine/threonine protein kinase
MAPELLDGSVSYTEKVDVYAFGILLNEMYERRQPFAGKDMDEIKSAVLQGQRPSISPTTPKGLKALIEQCWHQEAQKRPAFDAVSQMLTTAQAEAPKA